jgi:hypothetical protein
MHAANPVMISGLEEEILGNRPAAHGRPIGWSIQGNDMLLGQHQQARGKAQCVIKVDLEPGKDRFLWQPPLSLGDPGLREAGG